MRKKYKAQFIYKTGTFKGEKWLLIVDKNQGAMSVTNDIENVVEDIAEYEGIDPFEYQIIYRDSEGHWDGWDHYEKTFFAYPQGSARTKAGYLSLFPL